MKLCFRIYLTLALLLIYSINHAQIKTDHYPLLNNFYSQGGSFDDQVNIYIVEFRHSSEVLVNISYDKQTGHLILSFKDQSGSTHQETLKGFVPKYNQHTPSVITFYNESNQNQSVSVTEYNGGLSVIWNGEHYHMNS